MARTIAFEPAVREQIPARVGIFGPAGSGKTYTGLLLATELAQGKPIAVIDTEHGRSRLYANVFPHSIYPLTPPHHPEHYIAALKEAEAQGFAAVLMDSITHEWDGEGGVKEIVDQAKTKFGGNAHAAWSVGTPLHNKFVESILASRTHVICTMRSKVDWVIEEDERGRKHPRKIGTAPIQRDTIEYEFDVCMLMDTDNNGTVTKTHAGELFPVGMVVPKPGAEFAATLREWLGTGIDPNAPAKPEIAKKLKADISKLQKDFGDHESGVPWLDRIDARAQEEFGHGVELLTDAEAKKLIKSVEATRERLAAA